MADRKATVLPPRGRYASGCRTDCQPMTLPPKTVYVETTTRCNLRCRMCVKYAPGGEVENSDMAPSTFRRLKPLLTGASAVILNGIGEPLMNPALEEMIAYAGAIMPSEATIGFQSNGLLLEPGRIEGLLAAGLTEICLSLDSLDPRASGGEVHGGRDLARLERGFVDLAARKHRAAAGRFRLGVEIVVTRDNLATLPALLAWALERGADFGIVTHLLPYFRTAEEQSLFNPNTEAATALFQKWSAIAREQGIDLKRQHQQAWKQGRPRRNPAAALMAAMQQEARERGVWLNLDNLLRWQEENGSEAAVIFSEAAVLAEHHGAELYLPPLVAPDSPRCRFIDEQAVFITAPGLVAPCHLLWHSAVNILGGEALRIKARTFGSILREDPLSIWNKREYQAFRREASESAFPACRSCSVGPCPDITNVSYPFEYDCHGNTTPCGACLWGQGAVRCL